MTNLEIGAEVKRLLQAAFGEPLKGVVTHGSAARGEDGDA